MQSEHIVTDRDLALAVLGGAAVLLALGIVPAATLLRRAARAAGALATRVGPPASAAREAGAVLLARRAAAGLLGAVAAVLAVAAPARASALPASSGQAGHSVGSRPATQVLPAATAYDVVVVRRGDTLWDIARRHLPLGASDAAIARAWPRWYAANRAVIGSDPNLLIPGQRLRSPDRRPTGTSSSQHPSPAPPTEAVAPATSFDPDRR